MLILLGKTASGKDSIAKKLICEYGFKKIVTYTSRPPRCEERNGIDYYFIDTETFLKKIDNNDFMEYKVYHTVIGDWYYGTAKEDLINADERSVIILTPDGYRDFLKNCSNVPHVSILIKANRFITKYRLSMRGDNKKEAKRRLKHDNIDFKGCEDLVDYVVKNNMVDLDWVVHEVYSKAVKK